MKNLLSVFLLFGLLSFNANAQDLDTWGNGTNPASAVLLSIQPLPVDFGNMYTGNWKRGIGYSAIQSTLVVAAGITLANSGWGHHSYRNGTNSSNRGLTSAERNRLIWYSASYIAVKVISGVDAGRTAEQNAQKLNMAIAVEDNRPVLSLRVSF